MVFNLSLMFLLPNLYVPKELRLHLEDAEFITKSNIGKGRVMCWWYLFVSVVNGFHKV